MAILTKGKTFTNGELVTPQKLHELVDLGTVSGIVNADISASAAIADSKLAQITTANKVANSATSATNANTPNTIVARDGSGNFSAGTITANITGNVSGSSGSCTGNAATATLAATCSGNSNTATRLQTARTINGVAFDGSGNITVTADPTSHTHDDRYYTETEMNTLLAGKQASGSYAAASHTHDDRYYTEAEIDTKLSGLPVSGHTHAATDITSGTLANARTTAVSTNTANAIVARDASGNFSAGTITAALSGNATTATTLQTGRTINGVSFNGSANITITADPNAHTHDDQYYTETEMNTLLAGKQAAGSYAPATGIAPSAITGTAVVTSDSRLSDNRTPVDASVTTAKLDTATQQLLVPTGAIMAFAMNSAPSGWLPADGAAQSRSTFAALFTIIGTTYGAGNGTTTFNLPDLRGYFVRGAGTNADGTASGTFGTKQANAIGPHTHSGTTGDDSPDHTHQYQRLTVTNTGNFSPDGNGKGWPTDYPQSGGASTRHQHTFTTSSQSPAGTTETRPANIAMLYCIKF